MMDVEDVWFGHTFHVKSRPGTQNLGWFQESMWVNIPHMECSEYGSSCIGFPRTMFLRSTKREFNHHQPDRGLITVNPSWGPYKPP